MKSLLKYGGILLVLAGVLLLAIPFFLGISSNAWLTGGLACVITGFVAFILINKYLL